MNNVNEKNVMSDKKKEAKFHHLNKKEWFIIALVTIPTIPFIGWWSIVVFLLVSGQCIVSAEERINTPLYADLPEPFTPTKRNRSPIIPPKEYSWERDFVSGNFDPEPEPAPEPKVETLVITDHARRNLALRHGVITDRKHVRFEDLTPFEEEGEGCFTMIFPDINKSKKFAVFLTEDKSVIKTFMPHTDADRNRAYFKKHANLDSSLKDDLTKDLDFLQKVWLEKLSS